MRVHTPYTNIEKQYTQRCTENADLLLNKYGDELSIYKNAINFNLQRLGVVDYFKINNEEIITSVDYPDLLPNIAGYHYNNNLCELVDLGFTKHAHKYTLYYTKKCKTPKHIKKNNITIPSLFKNESNTWLEWYYSYYRSQGVDRFIMHYNGLLSERPDLPQYDDVEYVEWNVPIMQCRTYLATWYDLAHIQMSLFSLILKKYIPTSRYTLACDVDEIFYTPDSRTLLEYLDSQKLDQNTSGIRVGSKFTSIDFNNKTFNVRDMKLERHKIIYSHYYTHPHILLHNSCFNTLKDDTDLRLFHITNHSYSGPARRDDHGKRFDHRTATNFETFLYK